MQYKIQQLGQPDAHFPTMRDAVTALNARIGHHPAPFNNIEAHPDFVPFARFDRNFVAVGDLDDPATTFALRRVA